jgi:uncharacterized membrane protein
MQYPPPPDQPGSDYRSPYGEPQPNPAFGTAPAGGPGYQTSMGLEANIGALICYLSHFVCCIGFIVSIVFFFMEKTNKFLRFHAMQSLLLWAGLFVLGFAVGVVFAVLQFAFGILHLAPLVVVVIFLRILVIVVLSLGGMAIYIISAVKAYNGELYKWPIVGNLAENIAGK